MSTNYQAVVFEAPQGSEVIGSLLLPYFDNLANEQLNPILRHHGLAKSDINPQGWYSMQILMDISQELSNTGISAEDVAIGKAFAPMLVQQFNVSSIEQFFEETIKMVVLAGVRGVPDLYGYKVEKLGHQHYRITSNIPSPNGISYGSFWEACRLLKKDREQFSVTILRGLKDDYLEPAILEISVK